MNQKFHVNALELVNQKGFYHYEYTSDFESFKEKLLSKKSFVAEINQKLLRLLCKMRCFITN